MNNLKELEKTRKTFGYKELMQRIKFAFIPALKTEVLSPTPEQSSQVEKALKQNLEFPYATEILELIANFKFKLEHSKIDTRKDEDRKPTDIQFVNITGAWGRGPECESEVKALAVAMGEDGLLMDLVSMPGHGETSDMPQGWNTGELGSDFEFAAFTVADHINRNLKDNEKRPIIVNAWSMGGVSALKLAAQHPELVDGLILEDTPVFPQDIKKLSLRFMLYEIQKIRSVRSESSFDMNVDSPGLGIFSKRIKNRNKPEGIPFKVLVDSAKSLAKQDLLADGTIDKIAENAKAKNIPILLIRGSNDFVVPHGQTTRLYDELIKRGVDVKLITVEAAGHAVVGEQPVKVGGLIRKWLEEKKLVN